MKRDMKRVMNSSLLKKIKFKSIISDTLSKTTSKRKMPSSLRSLIFIFLFAFTFVSNCFSFQYLNDSNESVFSFNLGAELYHYKYTERDFNNSLFCQLKSPFVGVYGRIEYQPCTDGLKGRFDTRLALSNWGKYRSPGSGKNNREEYWISETQLIGLYPFNLDCGLTIEPYAGLGLRYFEDDGRDHVTTFGHIGYLRQSTYFYLPLGMQFTKILESNIALIPYFEYDFFIRGRQKSEGFIKNPQHKGYGLRGGIDLKIPDCYCNLTFFAGIFLRFWDIKDSKPFYFINERNKLSVIDEPKNKTYELGLRAGVLF